MSMKASLFLVSGFETSPDFLTPLEEVSEGLRNPDPMIEGLSLSGKKNCRHGNLLRL